MKNRILILSALLLCWMGAMAQRKSFESFEIYAPDTVHHGDRVTVIYTLKATNWQDYKHPNFPGFILRDHKFHITEGNRRNGFISTLQSQYELEAVRIGEIQLPAGMATVSKKERTSQTKTVRVMPNPRYAREMNVALNFLRKKGMSIDTCHLRVVTYKPEYLLFDGGNSDYFILVATAKYMPYLDNPILAYGFERGMPMRDDETFFNLVDIYKQQLHYLKERGERITTNTIEWYQKKNQSVSPLLGKTAWGQRKPYNSFCPKAEGSNLTTENQVVGCVPVAMAQIMRYHSWPACAEGKYSYISQNRQLFSMNFNKQIMEWENMRDTYDNEESDSSVIAPIARLMTVAGVSVGAQFGNTSTSANSNKIKMSLVNFFGYSPKCTHVISRQEYIHMQTGKRGYSVVQSLEQMLGLAQTGKRGYSVVQSPEQMLGLAYRELDEKRPLVVTNDNHAFVCDGYDGEYLHFNLGWEGYCNGFYRMIIVPGMKEYPLLYNDMVIGIEPDKQRDYAKTVEVKKAGTLATLLTEEEKENIHSLTIKGKLNGKDMELIRRMAGAVDNHDYFAWRGSLRHLDLEQAVFKGGKGESSWYYKQNAKDIGLVISQTVMKTVSYGGSHQTSTSSNSYDFQNLTENDWKVLSRKGLRYGTDYYLTEEDGKYYINYYAKKNAIGRFQFCDCSNLKSLVLPKKVKSIRDYAFKGCHSLQDIKVSKGALSEGVAEKAYEDTFLLQVKDLDKRLHNNKYFSTLKSYSRHYGTRGYY